MTYKKAQTEGKKNAAQHRKPNTTHCITACAGPTTTFPISEHSIISESSQYSNDNVKHTQHMVIVAKHSKQR